MVLKGQLLKEREREKLEERETGSINYDWLPSSGIGKLLLPNYYMAIGAVERKRQSCDLKLQYISQ